MTTETTAIELYTETKQQYPQTDIIALCNEEDMYITFGKDAEILRKEIGYASTFATKNPDTGKFVQGVAIHESELQTATHLLMKAGYRIAITRPRE